MSDTGRKIIDGLNEALAWTKGEGTMRVHLPDGRSGDMTVDEVITEQHREAPTMSEHRALTDAETAALVAFAAAHGRKWKDELSQVYWYHARIWTGPVPGMGNLLHGLRNTFGPTWLYDVCKLPKKG